MPSLQGAAGWINSEPLDANALHGKVVAVDFWTYTCINWMRTAPYLRTWASKYKDACLVVIGVHSPEFASEQDPECGDSRSRWTWGSQSLSTASMRSGARFTTSIGPRSILWMNRDESATSSLARAITTRLRP